MSKNKLQKFAENLSFGHLFQPSPLDLKDHDFILKGKWNHDFFKNDNPIVVELGCGKGDYTVSLAREFPKMNFIGMDIKGARLWRGCKNSQDLGLKNVAFIRTKIQNINHIFAAGEIDTIWITFPDPQPRQSKAEKRLTSPPFLKLYHKVLQAEGIIHLKTDNEPLFKYTLHVVEEGGHRLITHSHDIYAGNLGSPVTGIQTFYEKKWLSEGLKIHYLSFRMKKDVKLNNNESFFDLVFSVVRLIPFGRVSSYGAIARYLGTGGSARMVGWAMNASHTASDVPAHRVLNRNGLLTGKHHFGGPDTMRELLEAEGHQIVNDLVMDFDKCFWDPALELKEF